MNLTGSICVEHNPAIARSDYTVFSFGRNPSSKASIRAQPSEHREIDSDTKSLESPIQTWADKVKAKMRSKGTTYEQILTESADEKAMQKEMKKEIKKETKKENKELKKEKKEKLYKALELDKKSAFGVSSGGMTFDS